MAPLSTMTPSLYSTVQVWPSLIAAAIWAARAFRSVPAGSAYMDPDAVAVSPVFDGRYRNGAAMNSPPLGVAPPTPHSTALAAARLDSRRPLAITLSDSQLQPQQLQVPGSVRGQLTGQFGQQVIRLGPPPGGDEHRRGVVVQDPGQGGRRVQRAGRLPAVAGSLQRLGEAAGGDQQEHLVGRRPNDVLKASCLQRQPKRGGQSRQPGIELPPLSLDHPQRRQALGVLGSPTHLLSYLNSAYRQRQRRVELAEQHPPGGQGGKNAGLQDGRRLSIEQRHRLLAGLDRGFGGVAGLPPVTPQPLQQPGPVGRGGGAGRGQRVGRPPGGTARLLGPAGRLRRLLQQVRARLWQPPGQPDGQVVIAVSLGVRPRRYGQCRARRPGSESGLADSSAASRRCSRRRSPGSS